MNKEYIIDEKSFKNIFNEYFDPICHFLNLYTKDESVIENTIQEIFFNLWVNRDFLKINHIKSYLYTSARNRILNHIRNEKLRTSLLSKYMAEEKELQDAYECVDMDDFGEKLDNAISELPLKCQHIFKLSRYEKMTYKEIAEKEGISVKMVEKQISKALKKVKESVRNVPFILF